MFADVFDILFGCWHARYSFPITAKKGTRSSSPAARITGTYVVCLDCGKEFPYDWEKMKVITGEHEPADAALAAEPAGYKAA
jgi:hypothetical protein